MCLPLTNRSCCHVCLSTCCADVAGEEDVHVAPAIEDPTGGTAELEAELLQTPGPTGLPAHAAEGEPSSAC